MSVELRPHYGKHMALGHQVYLNQDRIFLDGRAVGVIGDDPGAVIALTVRLAPADKAAIEAEVLKQKNRSPETKEPPEVPPVLMQEDDIGDID